MKDFDEQYLVKREKQYMWVYTCGLRYEVMTKNDNSEELIKVIDPNTLYRGYYLNDRMCVVESDTCQVVQVEHFDIDDGSENTTIFSIVDDKPTWWTLKLSEAKKLQERNIDREVGKLQAEINHLMNLRKRVGAYNHIPFEVANKEK